MTITTVILDRDGVINIDSPDYILTPDQWQPVACSLPAIATLHQAGIRLGLASNQSARGRGMVTEETFALIHDKMITAIRAHGGDLNFIGYCPHTPEDHCPCRKPKAGLLHQALAALQSTPAETIMIGDSLRDVQAALAAGVRPVLVQTGYGDAAAIAKQAHLMDASISIYPDLAAVVDDLF